MFTGTLSYFRSSEAVAQKSSVKKVFFQTFGKIHRKTPVPEPLFWWSCRSEACNFIKKRDSGTTVTSTAKLPQINMNFWNVVAGHCDLESCARIFLWLIKCFKIQPNNYFDLTNYLRIQRNIYLYVQRNNSLIFNEIVIYIFNELFIYSTK